MQVIGQRHGILFRVRVVVRIAVGVFEPDGSGVAVCPVLRPSALDEEVLVGLPFGAEGKALRAADHRAWESPFGPVGVYVDIPVPAMIPPGQLRFQPQEKDVSVLPHQRGVKAGILIFAVAGQEFSVHSKIQKRQQLFFPGDGRVDRGEGTTLQADAAPVRKKVVVVRVQIDGGAGRIFPGRLQAVGLLPVVQRNQAQHIRGKPAQVHLHVLGVLNLDSVQEDAHVFAAQAAHVHSFQPPDTTIILHLHPRKAAQDARHLRRGRWQLGHDHPLRWFNDGTAFYRQNPGGR